MECGAKIALCEADGLEREGMLGRSTWYRVTLLAGLLWSGSGLVARAFEGTSAAPAGAKRTTSSGASATKKKPVAKKAAAKGGPAKGAGATKAASSKTTRSAVKTSAKRPA